MFAAPRQRAVDAAVVPETGLGALAHPVLLIHGRDDRVVPLETSLRLADLLPDARLVIYPRCGHWVQIERRVEFPELVAAFLEMPLGDAPAPPFVPPFVPTSPATDATSPEALRASTSPPEALRASIHA